MNIRIVYSTRRAFSVAVNCPARLVAISVFCHCSFRWFAGGFPPQRQLSKSKPIRRPSAGWLHCMKYPSAFMRIVASGRIGTSGRGCAQKSPLSSSEKIPLGGSPFIADLFADLLFASVICFREATSPCEVHKLSSLLSPVGMRRTGGDQSRVRIHKMKRGGSPGNGVTC